MAFKLDKTETAELEKLKKDVGEKFSLLETAVDEYNDKTEDLQGEVGTALATYNESLEAFRSFVNGIAEDRRDEFDDKSDSWKEGDNGSAAEDWISTWENAELDAGTIEFPDDLKIEFDNPSETELPTEA